MIGTITSADTRGCIQERKAYFCGFKTGCWWYTAPGWKAKREIQATRNLCVFVATEDSGT
jgi:hypothetical protein